MRFRAGSSGSSVLSSASVSVSDVPRVWAWEADSELSDSVEEIPQNFYQFLHSDKEAPAAEIKKAYRRLSLSLHPDKNKDENAETQFRQSVAIYEVSKDEERRRRYDDISENGLPDWRQPVFYYRRVRKMSNAESGVSLFLILTVGHYAVIWSIYSEKQSDESSSRKKKEKKKKSGSRPAEELRCISQDRNQDRPHWQDILPSKLSIWLYSSVKNSPQTVQEVKQYYEHYQSMKQKQKSEQAEAEQEAVPREKRPKVKKAKVEFPVYVPAEKQDQQNYEQTVSIEDIEDQMDDWSQDLKAPKKKVAEWTEDDSSLLSRLMVKFPGGTPGRWDKIAQELGRSVSAVTTKVKEMKDNVNQASVSGSTKLSDLKGSPPPVRSFPVDDAVMTQRVGGPSEEEEEEAVPAVRRRNKKSSSADGGEGKVRGRRQRDFDPTAEEEEEEAELQENKVNLAAWTQNQQKSLESASQQFPRGTPERWDRIAKVVPGKTKEDCMTRYKVSAESVKRRKQVKS